MYTSSTLTFAALVALARGHGAILGAQGDAGSPPSVGFGVNEGIARNCTTISPCQLDSTIIRDAEIAANIVNNCGRTELQGNIDVGESTENALAAGQVTSVQPGSKLTVTIHQVNADGAGPYACDLDMTSNAGVISHNLTVTNNIPGVNGLSQAKFQDFNITVEMPADLACTGASTGNVCTVRCRNNAVAGPFGGCFAVQQTGIKAAANTPNNIQTAQTLDGILAQLEVNKQDLSKAVAANQNAGSAQGIANSENVAKVLGNTVVSKAAAVQTPAIIQNGATAATSAAAAATTTAATKAGNNNKGNKNNGANAANNAAKNQN
ncbi:hypothetical protein GQ53DRAFT_832167 [Thozetella sp. PMI_491]|nr:hypothetical protein GQ53DRAFT_832167 [Thozetella sp. PMI_491]